jgi:hypothetical protein
VIGESYEVEQDDPDGTFGPMNRGDVVKNFVQYAPIKSGSAYYKKPARKPAFPVYVENIIVRDIQLVALPKQPDILQLRAEEQEDRARAPSRGLVLPFQAVITMGSMLAPSRQRDE